MKKNKKKKKKREEEEEEEEEEAVTGRDSNDTWDVNTALSECILSTSFVVWGRNMVVE